MYGARTKDLNAVIRDNKLHVNGEVFMAEQLENDSRDDTVDPEVRTNSAPPTANIRSVILEESIQSTSVSVDATVDVIPITAPTDNSGIARWRTGVRGQGSELLPNAAQVRPSLKDINQSSGSFLRR